MDRPVTKLQQHLTSHGLHCHRVHCVFNVPFTPALFQLFCLLTTPGEGKSIAVVSRVFSVIAGVTPLYGP